MPVLLQTLTFLGTCNSVPTEMRNTSSAAVLLDNGAVWLVDCGEGTQHQFLRASVRPTQISKIFITHMHSDHCYGLPGLLCYMGLGFGGPGGAKGDDEDEKAKRNPNACCKDAPDTAPASLHVVDIYGPFGLGTFLRTALRLSYVVLPYRYRIHEAVPSGTSPAAVAHSLEETAHPSELRPHHMWPSEALCYDIVPAGTDLPTVQAAVLQHAPGVFCIGYAFTEAPHPGPVCEQRLNELGVAPGPAVEELKAGRSVTLADGRQIHPADVRGREHCGRKVVILGDTCNSSNMLGIGRRADLLVQEATLDDATAHRAVPSGHSTARMAGAFAKQLEARRLVLTHFGGRFVQVEVRPPSGRGHSLIRSGLGWHQPDNGCGCLAADEGVRVAA
eukprot:EG_transcript_15848